MLRSIKRAHFLDPNNPELHSCLVRFLQHTERANLEGSLVGEVVRRQTGDLFKGRSAVHLNADFLERNSNSLPHLLQGARMLYLLEPATQQQAISTVTSLESIYGVTLKNCRKVLEALNNGDFGSCEHVIDEYKARCHDLFPFASAFNPPEIKPTLLHQQLLFSHHETKERAHLPAAAN